MPKTADPSAPSPTFLVPEQFSISDFVCHPPTSLTSPGHSNSPTSFCENSTFESVVVLRLVKGCENMQTQGQEHDIYSSKRKEWWKILELQWAFQVYFVSKPWGQLGVLGHKWGYSSWFMICIFLSCLNGTWMPRMDLGWYWIDTSILCNIKFDEV